MRIVGLGVGEGEEHGQQDEAMGEAEGDAEEELLEESDEHVRDAPRQHHHGEECRHRTVEHRGAHLGKRLLDALVGGAGLDDIGVADVSRIVHREPKRDHEHDHRHTVDGQVPEVHVPHDVHHHRGHGGEHDEGRERVDDEEEDNDPAGHEREGDVHHDLVRNRLVLLVGEILLRVSERVVPEALHIGHGGAQRVHALDLSVRLVHLDVVGVDLGGLDPLGRVGRVVPDYVRAVRVPAAGFEESFDVLEEEGARAEGAHVAAEHLEPRHHRGVGDVRVLLHGVVHGGHLAPHGGVRVVLGLHVDGGGLPHRGEVILARHPPVREVVVRGDEVLDVGVDLDQGHSGDADGGDDGEERDDPHLDGILPQRAAQVLSQEPADAAPEGPRAARVLHLAVDVVHRHRTAPALSHLLDLTLLGRRIRALVARGADAAARVALLAVHAAGVEHKERAKEGHLEHEVDHDADRRVQAEVPQCGEAGLRPHGEGEEVRERSDRYGSPGQSQGLG
mmetsp:Transcript_55042/g.175073  ORF Transcript_55042/g.175073 Transcript_55042/m.175073 type:complete len:505 (+) Transcript_55042:128-1642(+)